MAARLAQVPLATPVERSVQTVRAEIAEVNAEIWRTTEAALPIDELESSIRYALTALVEPANNVVSRAAAMLSAPRLATASDLGASQFVAEDSARLALGFALRAVSVDAIVAEARQRNEVNEAIDGAPLRLTRAEREARLIELRRTRYSLECEDVRLSEVAGIPLRADVAPAAALGVPADIAAKHGLFGE